MSEYSLNSGGVFDVALLPLSNAELAKSSVDELALAPLRDFRVRILPVFGPLLAARSHVRAVRARRTPLEPPSQISSLRIIKTGQKKDETFDLFARLAMQQILPHTLVRLLVVAFG